MKRQTAARLYEKKRPTSGLSHAVKTAPLNNLSAAVHREIDKYADDNMALEAAEHAESGAESAARLTDSAMRSRQLRQHRKAETAESKPEPSASNPISRRQQRRAIRNQYAAASSGRDAETAKQTAEKFREAAVKAAEFVRRHKKGFLIAGGVGLVLLFLLNVFSSCSVILESMGSSVAASTYPSGDEDMLGAEAAYCEMEAALEAYLEDYEETHEYDEYKYTLDSIEHDPYVLITILTALRGGEWTLEGVEKTLSEIFKKQYVLTEDATTEERTRTEIRTGTRKVKDPATGEEKEETYEYEEEVTYEGAGLNTIVLRLNEAGVMTPSHYKFSVGEICNEKQLGSGKWQTFTVTKILRSEVYTGDLVQGHTTIIDHKQVPAGPENLTVVRDTHEAIVSRELFDAVQKKLDATAQANKSRTVKPYTANILKGKIFCACCGGGLHRQRCQRKKTADRYVFHCLTNSRIAHGTCRGVLIYEDALMEALTGIILDNLDVVLGKYALCLEAPAKQRKTREELGQKIVCKKQEQARLRDHARGLYESLTLGEIDKDDYFSLRERYDSRLAQITEDLQQLEKGLAAIDAQIKEAQKLRHDAESIRKDRALTAELIDRLIERITVTPEKQITVQMKFQSEYDSYGEVLEKCRAM